jgi:putative DNA primase/helicase
VSVTTLYRRKSAQDILDLFGAVPNEIEENYDWRAFCSVHESDGEGHSPSLLIRFYPEPGKKGGRLDLLCGSAGCDLDKIKEAVGITRSDCFDVPMGEVAFTEKRRGAPSAMVAMTLDHRVEADRDASEDAFRLASELVSDQAMADRLLKEYGIQPATSTDLYKLGVGLNSDEWLTITARTPAGSVAFRQRRNRDPDAPKHSRWLSQKNVEGESGPMKWDALGIVGERRPDAPILITEGMSDALTLATLQTYEVIATRGAFGSNYVHQIKDELLARDVILVPDTDRAGAMVQQKMRNALAPIAATVRVVEIPDGCKDVREWFQADPETFPERFAKLVEGAPLVNDPSVVAFDPSKYLKGSDADRGRALRAWLKAQGLAVAWTPAHGYLVYDQTCWRPDAEHVVMHQQTLLGYRIRQLADELPQTVLNDEGKTIVNPRIEIYLRLARKFLDASPRDALVKVLRSDSKVRRDHADFDAAPELLAVGNGVVNLRTGELRRMVPQDLITRRIETEYHPQAKAEQFEEFLSEVLIDTDRTTDPELVEYIQRVIGYAITGYVNRPARYLMFVGRGGDGKSTFTGMLSDVLGAVTEWCSFATFAAGDSASAGVESERAKLAGARLVFTGESGKRDKIEGDFLKAFTGGDAVSAKYMRQNVFTYRPNALVITSTNHMPTVDGVDKAIWRRLRVVPWRREFSEAEFDLGIRARIVEDEAEGILAWAVAGAQAYLAKGLDDEPAQVTKATAATKEDQNPLTEFVQVNLIITGDEQDWVVTPVMWERYNAWCEFDHTPRQLRKGKKNFFRDLDAILPSPRTGGSNDWPAKWKGVQVKAPEIIAREYATMVDESMAGDVDLDELQEHILDVLRARAATKKFGLKGETRFGKRDLKVVS